MLTRGPGRSVARGELLADGPALARERVSRVRRERAAVLGLAPRGLSAGGGKLGRERGLGWVLFPFSIFYLLYY